MGMFRNENSLFFQICGRQIEFFNFNFNKLFPQPNLCGQLGKFFFFLIKKTFE